MENSISSNNSKESSSWLMYIDHFRLLSEGKAVSPSNTTPQFNNSRDDTSYLLKDLGFKKRRKEIPFDDSLEDTASSVNISKVKDLYHSNAPRKKRKDSLTKKKEDAGLIFQMKNDVKIQGHDKAHEMSSANEIKYDCNALRKRGLCLVPLSMLIDHYLG